MKHQTVILKCTCAYISLTYSVTGSSGLEGEMESDMVAVRHRDVPGDLTRSSTCNKTNAVRSIVDRSFSPASQRQLKSHFAEFPRIHCDRFSDSEAASRRDRWRKVRGGRTRRILRAILATVDGELSNR